MLAVLLRQKLPKNARFAKLCQNKVLAQSVKACRALESGPRVGCEFETITAIHKNPTKIKIPLVII